MSLDSLKRETTSHLEKRREHAERQTEFDESYRLFQELESASSRLDDTVLEQLGEMRRGYEERAGELAMERTMLSEERSEMEDTIQKELETLRQTKAKLEAAAEGTYGTHVQDALRACDRSIEDYQALLAQIGADTIGENGDLSAMREHVNTEQRVLSELMVEADAAPLLSTLTAEERSAVQFYTGSGYDTINPVLRNANGVDTASRETLVAIRNLHNVLSRQTTRCPITVYRGVRDGTRMVRGTDGAVGLDALTDEQLVGKLLVDGAFVSTSTRESTCHNYTTRLVLELPAGSYGAYVGDISLFQHSEREFLMDMNQAFRVRRVERRDGIRYIYATSLRRRQD